MNQQQKYHYLDQSFDKGLQRSYDRGRQYSPPSVNSPQIRSPHKQSQFSPYQNKQPQLREKLLIQELKTQNHILNDQICEYKMMIDKLHIELRTRDEEVLRLQAVYQKQQDLKELKLREMHEQINVLLTKNTYLEERSLFLDKEVERQKIQQRNRSVSMNLAVNSQKSKFLSQLNHLLNLKEKQNKIHSFSQNPSPKKSVLSEEQILEEISSLMKKMGKYKELFVSISEMYHKINSRHLDSGDLKHVWKWLKQLGHNYNMISKWKKMLVELLGLSSAQDMSIDDVLQKTVVALHHK